MKSYYKQWREEGKLGEILDLVRKWRADGAELNEIADKLGIARSVLFDYQSKYADFADALKTGAEIMDGKVENSLIKECVGYEYEETTTTTTAIINKATGQVTNMEKVERRTTKRYARPSVSAIAYYLNNRCPDRWNNRIVLSSDIDQATADEIEGIVAKTIKAGKR